MTCWLCARCPAAPDTMTATRRSEVSQSLIAMSGASVRVLCALLGVLAGVTSSHALSCVNYKANTTWSPCPGMTPNKDIHLDQLSGKWYMHQQLIPTEGAETNTTTKTPKQICIIMSLAKTDRGFLAAGTTPGAQDPWRSNATLVVQEPDTYPGLWDETIINDKGVETTISRSQLVHQDRQSLVVAICPPYSLYACNELGTKPTILVWGRNATANSLDLGPINAKLRQAGISYVNKAEKIDTSACSGHIV